MTPRGQRQNFIGPIHLAAQRLLFHTIQIITEKIIPGLGRDLPPEGECRGAHHHALHEGALPMGDGPGLSRITPVMGRYALGKPGESAPGEKGAGGVKSLAQRGRRHQDRDGKSCRPGHPPPRGDEGQRITPQNGIRRRRQGHDRTAGTGHGDGCRGECDRYPRGKPGDPQGNGTAEPLRQGGEGRAPRPPRSKGDRRRECRQGDGALGRKEQLVHPPRIGAASPRTILGIYPA